MTASPPELLRRMAATLRTTIGPAVEEPFARTQAFMAAVVLGKLAGQLEAAAAEPPLADAERLALVTALERRLPPGPAEALDALGVDGSDGAWSRLVSALYAGRGELGDDFEPVLRTVREALRTRLDRTLAYAS
jgi:hypothetical protein